jgi:hypothetical protein
MQANALTELPNCTRPISFSVTPTAAISALSERGRICSKGRLTWTKSSALRNKLLKLGSPNSLHAKLISAGTLPRVVRSVKFMLEGNVLSLATLKTCVYAWRTIAKWHIAIALIGRNAVVYNTADKTHCAEIQALAVTAALRLEESVAVVTAPPTTVPGTENDCTREREQQRRRAEPLETNAKALAKLVSSLSAVEVQLSAERATITHKSTATREASKQVIISITDKMEQLIAQLTESASNAGADAPHVIDQAELSETIIKLDHQLRAVQGAAPSWEERAIQRYQAEADKVCTETSPAHPHISDCWRKAAEDLKLAVQLSAAETADTRAVYWLRAYSQTRSKLAAGTFTDAGTYYAKAERSTRPLAMELWTEAADLLVRAGVSLQPKDEDTVAGCGEGSPASNRARQLLRCAEACAACAEALDRSAAAKVVGADSALLLTTTANTVDEINADTALKMRLMLVQVERFAMIRPDLPSDAVDKANYLLNNLRTTVVDVLHLSISIQAPETAYPAGHLLYQPPLSEDEAKHRYEQLRWQCDHVERCVNHLLRIPEHQELLSDSTQPCCVAVDNLQTSVNLADAVRYFTFRKDPRNCPAPAFTVHFEKQACLYRVQSHRYLAASQLVLEDKHVVYTLVVRAAERCWKLQSATQLMIAVSNALIRRAYQEATELECTHLPQLLLPITVCATVEQDESHEETLDETRWLQRIVELHVKQISHEQADASGSYNSDHLRKKAIALYKCAIKTTESLIESAPYQSAAQVQRLERECARAERAGLWCIRVLETYRRGAEPAGVVDVTMLYGHAIVYATAVATSGARHVTNEDQAQDLADKAGIRFAAAAEALVVGNMSLYVCWLQAATATAALVTLTPILVQGKGTEKVKVVCSTAYTADAVTAADALETQALALQAVQQQQGK